ncbi:MAG: DUF374 domain-containing protein [Chitinivibrionales bacterium]|nr:DUF374 domain-containing protein [Chitinivibrionales bacterium]
MRIPLPNAFTTHSLWLIFSLIGKTWNYRYKGIQEYNPLFTDAKGLIYCFWHSRILALAYGFRNCGITTVVSSSRDGDLAVDIVKKWGQDTIRGSSSSGGVSALRACRRALAKGARIAIVPDGPRGPKEIVKPGVAQLAHLTGTRVIPVRAVCKDAWILNSWDAFVIPRPFARIEIHFMEAVRPCNALLGKDEQVDRIQQQIQKALAS